jgi:hypothetical protein
MPFTFPTLMEELVRLVGWESYNRYWDKPELTNAIFRVFLTQLDRTYSMQSVHEKTVVPLAGISMKRRLELIVTIHRMRMSSS